MAKRTKRIKTIEELALKYPNNPAIRIAIDKSKSSGRAELVETFGRLNEYIYAALICIGVPLAGIFGLSNIGHEEAQSQPAYHQSHNYYSGAR